MFVFPRVELVKLVDLFRFFSRCCPRGGRGHLRRGVPRLAAVGWISEDRLRRIPRNQALWHVRQRDPRGVVKGRRGMRYCGK